MLTPSPETTASDPPGGGINISNAQFLGDLFHELDPQETLWVCTFPEPPSPTAKWGGYGISTPAQAPSRPRSNAYFSVATLRPDGSGQVRRRLENFSRLHVVVLDDSPAPENLRPTWILETSRPAGRSSTQVGFRLRDPISDPNLARRLHNALAAAGHIGNDRSGNNPVRYVRLAAGSNTKHKPPHPHRLLAYDPSRAVTLDELCAALRLDLTANQGPDGASQGGGPDPGSSYFAKVNRKALTNLPAWVPWLFSTARTYQDGFRITSRDLGRELEEDISILPVGIRDFGEEKPKTAIDLVLDWGQAATAADAAEWLCHRLGLDPAALGWRDRRSPPFAAMASDPVRGGACKFPPDHSNSPPPWPNVEAIYIGPNDHHQEQPPAGDEWPEPADLSAVVVPEPYPVHCLPRVAREAVIEYQAFGQQPMSLVGMSALQNMALAGQGLADVARNVHLVSPISLNAFLLAMSGERKTAADKIFGRAARDWQSKAREELTPDYRRALAMAKAWHSRQEGVRKRITALAAKDPDPESGDGKELDKLRERLVELEQNPVIARPLPMLFYEDVTPGGLQHSLATGWPSAGLFSDEGGAVIGGHGMGEDTATSMLATLNILWDGRPYIPTRKTAAAAELRGRRFSCFIMVQPDLITKLLEKGARHIGFIARFLVAHPVTTMGTRFYRDPPSGWQAMNAFDQAITHLLKQKLPVDESDSDRGLLMRLTPQVMHLSTRAKRRFIEYHDEVERQLIQFGELEGVRDIASKSAENACRIAAVCQIFDQGRPTPEVEEEYMESGIGLASWHLNEAMAMFAEIDGPQHISDAQELATWLTGRGRELADSQGIPVIDERGGLAARDIQRVGPNRVRDSARRDAALAHLEECGWVRQFINGRQKRVLINPKLMKTQ